MIAKKAVKIALTIAALLPALILVSPIAKFVVGQSKFEIAVRQALPNVKSRFNAFATLPDTVVLSEHFGWAQCGNADWSSPVYTQLYFSKLPKEQIQSHYDDAQFIDVYFIDFPESKQSPKYLPCFYYLLFEGHNIPSQQETSGQLFIVYGFADEVFDRLCAMDMAEYEPCILREDYP